MGKGKKSPNKKGKEAATEKRLETILKQLDVDVSEGPIWKTVRVSPSGMSCRRNAGLRDLVEGRGRLVHDATNGRVGYLHCPDTMNLGVAEFYRYFSRECERDALIVDLRCNSGGCFSEFFLKQLRNTPIGWSMPRPGRGAREACPEFSTSGRLVLLVDERTSSDGECWAQTFRESNLAKVVGVRTWGGVVELGGANVDCLDGGYLSIPYMHYYIRGIGYGLENSGVLPDIVVDRPPSKDDSQDVQLQEAIKLAEQMLADAHGVLEIPRFPPTRLHKLVK